MIKKINQLSGMPQIGAAFSGWQTKIALVVITQTIVDGLTVDTPKTITFNGVVQPLSAKQIALKPEGQRAWAWLQIHCFSGNLNLKNNDRIKFNERFYKVMGVWDWSLDNYIEYHAVEDFQ